MRATTHKTLRDLRRQAAQAVAVAITVMLGVLLFIATAGAFRNLSDSYEHTYDRLHFADLVATGGDAPAVAAAARERGARAVAVRTQVDPPLLISGTKLLGRVVGLPGGTRPTVDDVDVVSGTYLAAGDPDGVLVERHAADTFDLTVGDTLQVFTVDGWRTLTVRGIAISAEYLWPARSRQEVLSDPHGFAVVFAPEQSVRQWAGTGPNQVLATAAASTTATDTTTADLARRSAAEIDDAMRRAGAIDVTPRSEQPSHGALKEDLDGFSEMSVAFPLLFLIAAAVAASVLLTRRVLAERSIIGTLMAAGARRGPLVRHYLLQGLLIGLAGGIAGVILGVLATSAVTTAYTGAFGIPDTTVSQHPELAVIGIILAAVVGLVGSVGPASRAARTAPAEAMRNQPAARRPGWYSRAVARMRALPVTARMGLRDVFRSPRRTLATMLGTVLASVLVLASVGMITSFDAALRTQFDEVLRQDATVSVAPAVGAQTEARLRGLAGVSAVEQVFTAPVVATYGSRSYTTVLTGYRPGTEMHGFHSVHGDPVDLPADGLLAGVALADRLGVAPGQTLSLSTPDGNTVPVRLAGFVEEPLGTSLYTTSDLAHRLVPVSLVATFELRFPLGTDRDKMRNDITALPGVLSYTDIDAVASSLDQFLNFFWVFIAIMVTMGAVLAFAVIYVTMTVNVVERTNELATLRAAGVPLRRIAWTLATENLVATVLGIPFGLALGVLASWQILASFNGDLFRFPFDLGWWSLPAAALGVLLAAALSQLPAARAVRRLDVARVVRERAT